MRLLDWILVGAYLAYVVYDGVTRSRATSEVRGYFLANRSLPWWAVGLSIMATQMSAITLVGTTGQAYADGMRFSLDLISQLVEAVPCYELGFLPEGSAVEYVRCVS